MKVDNQQLTYWITGASSGIGLALTQQLVNKGHRVVVSGRSVDKLKVLAERLGPQVIELPCDVSNDEQMKTIFNSIADRVSLLDCVILCAGVCEYIDYPDLDINSIKHVTAINYFGTVNSCIAALPLLEKAANSSKKNRGHLIGVSSMSCYLGFPRAQAYGSSKAAMSYFLDSLRADIGDRLDITVVYPGFVDTPLTRKNDFPMPFLISAEQAAEVLLRKSIKRPYSIKFPWRLHALLVIVRFFSSIWYRSLTPLIKRNQDKQI